MQKTTQFQVTSVAALMRHGTWRLSEPHARKAPVLYIFTKGQGRITVAGRTRGFNAPSLLFVPAGTMQRFDFSGPVFAQCVEFTAEMIAELPGKVLFLRRTDPRALAEITQLVQKLEAELTDGDGVSDRAARSYAMLLGVTLERLGSATDDPPWVSGKSGALVSRFTGLIEEDLRAGALSKPSVSAYASRMGITPTHLNRVCQSVAGQAASVLLQDRIVSEARRKLADTNEPVQRIACTLGFQSPAYFSRAFGQRTGLTPTAARAQDKKTPDAGNNAAP